MIISGPRVLQKLILHGVLRACQREYHSLLRHRCAGWGRGRRLIMSIPPLIPGADITLYVYYGSCTAFLDRALNGAQPRQVRLSAL